MALIFATLNYYNYLRKHKLKNMSNSQTNNDNQTIDQATSQSPTDPRFKPIDLNLDRQAGLSIKWADGASSQFPLDFLRKRCPCATCRDQREKTSPTPVQQQGGSLSLNILPTDIDRATQFGDAKLVGRYAIQITWGDGHNTGIYDFRFLRMIDPQADKADS